MATKTTDKQCCPTCGQSVNKRYITLNKSMVGSLVSVLRWCKKEGKHEFSRKEVKHLFKTESESAHFGNWVHFGGVFYKKSKGSWGINIPRAESFLQNLHQITTSVLHDPLADTYEAVEWGRCKDVKGIEVNLDEEGDYVVEYKKQAPVKLPPSIVTCESCMGKGRIEYSAGLRLVEIQCSKCQGKGKITL